jgi:phage terminase large subunit-like protein
MTDPRDHAVTEYAERVLSGEIVTGELVRLACERHMRDLDRDDLWFDCNAADNVIEFFGLLPHTKGVWAKRGERIQLELWQQFMVGSVFGWKRTESGLRRFRKVYTEIARKNAKSTLLAGVCLYLLGYEDEAGAEIYSAATKKDQAKILWNTAAAMIAKRPQLASTFTLQKSTNRILIPDDIEAVFRPLSREDNVTGDGLNVFGAAVDELHAHPTDEIFAKLETGMGAREEPILWSITTPGESPVGVCWREREYARNVLEGTFEDDTVFGYIACLDEGDDPFDPANWPKANPNMVGSAAVVGGSVRVDYLEDQARRAKNDPQQFTTFCRYHCGLWVSGETAWLTAPQWAACGADFDLDLLRSRKCYGGLDLAKVNDLSALVLVFPPDTADSGEPWYVVPYFWCPDADIMRRTREDRVPYDVWQRDGWIETTPGNVTDYGFIKRRILEVAEIFDLREIAFDRHFAHELIQSLQGELGDDVMVPFGQGFVSMATPVDETKRLILSDQIAHDRHPILTWMAGNAVVVSDAADNHKLDKDKSRERIDGMVALVMAVGRAHVNMLDDPASVYESRGLAAV